MGIANRLQRLSDRWATEAHHTRETAVADRLQTIAGFVHKHGLLDAVEREALATLILAIRFRHGGDAARAYVAAATRQPDAAGSGPCA